jgi:hypothetical protein
MELVNNGLCQDFPQKSYQRCGSFQASLLSDCGRSVATSPAVAGGAPGPLKRSESGNREGKYDFRMVTNRLLKKPPNTSFRGAERDEESRNMLKSLASRFFAEFILSETKDSE